MGSGSGQDGFRRAGGSRMGKRQRAQTMPVGLGPGTGSCPKVSVLGATVLPTSYAGPLLCGVQRSGEGPVAGGLGREADARLLTTVTRVAQPGLDENVDENSESPIVLRGN